MVQPLFHLSIGFEGEFLLHGLSFFFLHFVIVGFQEGNLLALQHYGMFAGGVLLLD